jgi:hypothetical protein
MKSSKLFWLISCIGIILWLVVLSILTMIPFSPVRFTYYDFLHKVDVSSQYSFNITLWGYLFDPPITFFKEILIGDYGYILIFGTYLVIRFAFWVNHRYTQEDYPSVFIRMEKVLNFFSGVFLYLILSLFIFILGASLIAGPLAIITYGFSAIHIIVVGLTFIGIIIILGTIILFILPNSFLGKKIQQWVSYWEHRPRKSPRKTFTQHVKLARISKEIRRIAVLGLLFGYFILCGYALPVTTRIIQTELEPNEFLFDLHVHTCRSDGWPTPAQRVEWYRSHGIQGAAFSDHHSINGAMEAQAYVERNQIDFTVWIAQEYSPTNIHMNIYGINETINPIVYTPGINFGNPRISSLYLNVSDTIKYVKANGGYITVNHYGMYGSEEIPYSLDQLRDWGVDGFEIVNMGRQVNASITTYCLTNNLICMGGSDSHEFNDLDTFIRLRLDDPQNRSIDAIFQALKRNDHQVVALNRNRPESGGVASNLGSLGTLFLGLNTYQRLSWWIWSGIVIMAICLLKLKFRS